MKKLHILAVLTACLLIAGIAIAATGSGHNFTTSTNLHLLKPIPGITGGLGVEPSGTSWMELQNRSFDLLDAHNHSPGNGAPVPTSGLNINADLPFNSFNATLLRALRLNSQSSTLGGAGDLRAIYSVLGDLYYNNAAGTPVQITSGGGIAGTPGSIGGLASPASATYTAGTTTFTFQGATNTAATGDFGTIILREKVASALGITLQSPTGLAGAYSLTMPTALPGSDGILRLGSTGVLSAFGTISGSNLTLPGTLGVTGTSTFTGNVGIGVAPSEVLTVQSPATVDGTVRQTYRRGDGVIGMTLQDFAGAGAAGVPAGNSMMSLGATGNGKSLVTAGSVTIGTGGTAISGSFRGTAVIVGQLIAAGACLTETITVTGAVAGSECAYGTPSGSALSLSYGCHITAADTCKLVECNPTGLGITETSGTYACRAWNP